MAENDLRKGVYLKYADLVWIPGLLTADSGFTEQSYRQREGGLLIPYTLKEGELEALLKAENVGYYYPANHCYCVRTRLFGTELEFEVRFWFTDGRHDSVDIRSKATADRAHFRQLQGVLRPMLGKPLEQLNAGPLGFLSFSDNASAEWYDQGVSIEHVLETFMGRREHHIRIRNLG